MPTLTDTALSAQGAHIYTVRSIDVAGNVSAPSNTLTVIYDTTPPHTPTGLAVPTPTQAAAPDVGRRAGRRHRRVRSRPLQHLPRRAARGHTPTTTFDDSSVPADGSFGYSITAVDRAGNESLYSRTVIIRYDGTPPLPPLDPNGATPTRLPTFTWAAVSDQATGGSAIASYRIYRNGSYIGETAGTSYVDGNVVVSGHQIYTVRAIDAAGNISAPSRALDLIVDLEGPILDAVSFPAQRAIGALVDFQVVPRDALSPIAGAADVGLRRRLRVGQQGHAHLLDARHVHDHRQGVRHARQHDDRREPLDPHRGRAGRHEGRGAAAEPAQDAAAEDVQEAEVRGRVRVRWTSRRTSSSGSSAAASWCRRRRRRCPPARAALHLPIAEEPAAQGHLQGHRPRPDRHAEGRRGRSASGRTATMPAVRARDHGIVIGRLRPGPAQRDHRRRRASPSATPRTRPTTPA